ncbi:MAG TPA: GNAT family N-acetyltransferase [Thermoanaerobaculia bacterium]|nr:GNAT family N-acetyltransferase [Thermoanaerobaculia bacterium]
MIPRLDPRLGPRPAGTAIRVASRPAMPGAPMPAPTAPAVPAPPHAPKSALHCEVVTDLGAVEALAPWWEVLLERSRCNRAFSSPRWFLASCQVMPEWRPYLVVARRGRELAGVLPLRVDAASRTAELGGLLSDYNDVVADPAAPEVAAALLAFAGRAPHPFDRLLLGRLRPDSCCLQALPLLAPGAGRHLLDSRICPYARLPPSFAEYLRGRGERFRKGLRNAANRAARQGAAVRELTPAELPGGALPDAFLRLHDARFGGKSCFDAAVHRRLAVAVLPPLFAAGRLKVFGLLRGTELLGIDVCPLGPDSLCVWNGGFAGEAAAWSAGKLLIAAEIACACRLGLAELDLLVGAEDYKLAWTTHLRGLADLELIVQ